MLDPVSSASNRLIALADLSLHSTEPAFLAERRRWAAQLFVGMGVPSRKAEAWRFTDLSRVEGTAWRLARGQGSVSAGELERLFDGCPRLVFVDGRLAPALSSRPADFPAGVTVTSLAEAAETRPQLLERHLGRHARIHEHPFAALGSAAYRDGALVEVAEGTEVEQAVHVVFLSSGSLEAAALFPRIVVVAGAGSRMQVVETHTGSGGSYLSCPVGELVVGEGAELDHYRVVMDAAGGCQLGLQHADVGKDARLLAYFLSFGGGLVRTDVQTVLAAEGSRSVVNGLYLATGEEQVTTAMNVDHAKPGCTSRELFAGIVGGTARATFTGRVRVEPGADGTDAKQSNRSLLLSPDALVHSNPQLEILADDVRCTHGSTVGQLDDEATFYLRSRGIGAVEAKRILTRAFAADVIAGIRLDSLREWAENELGRRLDSLEELRA